MTPEHMDELEIRQNVEKECELRRQAENDPNVDPAIYAPWGRMSYPEGYKRLKGKCERPD